MIDMDSAIHVFHDNGILKWMRWTFGTEKKPKWNKKIGLLPFHIHLVCDAVVNGVWLEKAHLKNMQGFPMRNSLLQSATKSPIWFTKARISADVYIQIKKPKSEVKQMQYISYTAPAPRRQHILYI